jgi:hypothetical protein
VRMYNETHEPDICLVSVKQALHPGDQPGAFHAYIEGLVQSSSGPWKAFADAAARAVHVRAQNLRARTNSAGYQSG